MMSDNKEIGAVEYAFTECEGLLGEVMDKALMKSAEVIEDPRIRQLEQDKSEMLETLKGARSIMQMTNVVDYAVLAKLGALIARMEGK